MLLLLNSFLISAFAIFITTLSGGGNNLVLFPLLLAISPSNYISTFAVAKASAAIHSITSSKIHLKKNQFHKPLMATLILSACIGTTIGTYILEYSYNEKLFKLMLGCILLISAIYILLGTPKINDSHQIQTKDLIITSIFSIGINILNGLFGGTGIFLTAFLMIYLRMSFKKALAITAVSYLTVNILQAGYLLATQDYNFGFLISSLVGAALGSYLATNLIYLKSSQYLKYLSPVLMSIIGITIIATNLQIR